MFSAPFSILILLRPEVEIEEMMALELLRNFTSRKCCWGTGAAKKAHIERMQNRTLYHVFVQLNTARKQYFTKILCTLQSRICECNLQCHASLG